MADSQTMKVNGPARIKIGLQGAAPADYLGLSDKGVRVRIQFSHQDVETDASGPTPADVQEFPSIATIKFRLVSWAEDILTALRSKIVGNVGTYAPGETLPPGTLLLAAGAMKSIRIDAPYGQKPIVFGYCHPADAIEVELGTQRMAWDITLRAIAGIGVNSDPGGLESDANLNSLYYYPNS